MASLYFIILCIAIRILAVSSDQECATFEQCVGQSLVDSGTTLANGYKSAHGATTSFNGGSIECCGSFSCNAMEQITAVGNIDCLGSESCSNSELQTENEIQCFGASACSYSNLVSTVTSELDCAGYLSCRDASIDSTDWINAYGSLSLFNAVIDSNGISNNKDTITLWMDGYMAGFGAKLICRSGHTCDIKCRGANSCYMFYTECIGTCNVAKYGRNIGPITNIDDYNNLNRTIPKYFNSELAVPHNDQLCTIETCNYDNNKEHWSGSDITVNTPGPFCCRGRESCRNVGEIMMETTVNNDLICSGHRGCEMSNLISTDGVIYCEGKAGCKLSNITNADHIYCASGWACEFANIRNANQVVCGGHTSCQYSTFISGGSDLNVYFGGRHSGRGAIVYCNQTDSCSIYCYGKDACISTVLYCVDNCYVECEAADSQCPTQNRSLIIPTTAAPIPTTEAPILTTEAPINLTTEVRIDPTTTSIGTTTRITTENPTTTEPSQTTLAAETTLKTSDVFTFTTENAITTESTYVQTYILRTTTRILTTIDSDNDNDDSLKAYIDDNDNENAEGKADDDETDTEEEDNEDTDLNQDSDSGFVINTTSGMIVGFSLAVLFGCLLLCYVVYVYRKEKHEDNIAMLKRVQGPGASTNGEINETTSSDTAMEITSGDTAVEPTVEPAVKPKPKEKFTDGQPGLMVLNSHVLDHRNVSVDIEEMYVENENKNEDNAVYGTTGGTVGEDTNGTGDGENDYNESDEGSGQEDVEEMYDNLHSTQGFIDDVPNTKGQ